MCKSGESGSRETYLWHVVIDVAVSADPERQVARDTVEVQIFLI